MTAPGHAPGRCRDLLVELFDYLDDDLSPDRCRVLERHLDACPCCGELAANLRKAIAMCRAEGRRRMPAAVRARARRRVTELLNTPPPRAGER
jgi:anti-sigma factor RsiW